jgi:tetratricopeptide (TPR) repeat protein
MRLKMSNEHIVDRRYILARQLGKGGMGAVYEATDRLSGEHVALKLVNAPTNQLNFASRKGDLNLQLALAQEFKVLASLRHPNIISVLTYGFDDNQQPYFTMDLLDDAVSPSRAVWGKDDVFKVNLLIQILQALAYLHRRDIMHRDLKPANVRIIKEAAKVLDFGLSIRHQDYEKSDKIVGTIEYMAPELLRQAPPSIESDLYALGVMGWELFTGEYLFDNSDIRKLAQEIFHKIPDPSEMANQRVAMVLSRLMAKNAEDRYASAEDTIQAFCDAINQPLPQETIAIRESYLQRAELVGREKELKMMSEMLGQTANGTGQALIIGGESGVGKSRLLDELRTFALVQGAIVLRGEGVGQGRSPYQIWREIVRGLVLGADIDREEAGILAALVPDIEDLSGVKIAKPDDDEPHARQQKLITVIEKLFRQQQQPMLVLLEDMHWAGFESAAVLDHLLRLLDELPVFFVISYREDESPDLPSAFPKAQEMRLERLDERNIEELAVAMLGDSGREPSLLQLLKSETEGNVFFLVEIVRALAEEAGQLDQISTMNLPRHVFTGNVNQIIQRRLKKVPLEIRPLVNFAAVAGRYLDYRLLSKVVEDPDTLDAWLGICANAAVLDIDDGSWRFSHEKIRDAVLDQMPAEEARDFHREVALAIEDRYISRHEGTEKFAMLAYHWGEAQDAEKEAHYSGQAGEDALSSGSYRDAIRQFERSLQLMGEDDDPERAKRRAELLRRIGNAFHALDQYQDAAAFYNDSLNLFKEVDYKWGVAFAYSDLGTLNFDTQDYDTSYQNYRNAIETAMSVKAQRFAIAGVLGIAKLMHEFNRDEWAIELAAFVIDQPMTDRDTSDRAQKLLDGLQGSVPADAFEQAKARGEEKRLAEVVQELLEG